VILGGLGVIAVLDRLVGTLFGPKKIFVSYYYDKDRDLKRLLQAWSKNDKFDIEFEDMSADVSLGTKTDEELERELTIRIKRSDVVLVLIGSSTHSRKWVNYEIKEAVRLSKPIVAVKQDKNHISPKELKGVGANWVYGFRAKKVSKALKECI
jgi:hypothetical protein